METYMGLQGRRVSACRRVCIGRMHIGLQVNMHRLQGHVHLGDMHWLQEGVHWDFQPCPPSDRVLTGCWRPGSRAPAWKRNPSPIPWFSLPKS